MQPILIIGVGNPYRRDDGAGNFIAKELASKSWSVEDPAVSKTRRDVTVVEQSGEGIALLDRWQGADTVFMIDAVASGAAPGTLFRFDAKAQAIPSDFFHYSTHAFSVAEAIELARTLQRLPAHLTVYGIEGQYFGAGVGLSAQVQEAALKLVDQIAHDVAAARAFGGARNLS